MRWIAHTFSQSCSSTLLPPWLQSYAGSHLATAENVRKMCGQLVDNGELATCHEEVGVPPPDK